MALAIVLVGAVVGATAALAHQATKEGAKGGKTSPAVTRSTTSTTSGPKQAQERTDAELVRTFGGAIWRVETEGCGVEASGTAWVIDARHLVTNAHVVAHDPNPIVRSRTGRALSAVVVGISKEPDIAVLRVAEDLPQPLHWADTSDLTEGQHVVGLGYPVPGTDFSASPGTIVSFQTQGNTRVAIRTDAAVDHGDSGGPLMTSRGEVAGVVTELADNDTGVQVVPIAYTAVFLADDVASMLEAPRTPVVDCSWVSGEITYPSLPESPPTVPLPSERIDPYDYEPPEIPFPTDPPTTTVPCPAGKPSVTVTEVRAKAVDPQYSPGYWEVTVRGRVRNDTAASVDISSVMVQIAGAQAETYASVNDFALRPGASTTFSATEYYLAASAQPDSATARLDSWSWADFDFYDCGTG
jgi:S1-C subfamily serine protease